MKEAREFEAEGEEKAVRAAAKELGITEEEVEYRVVEEGSRGFLGMGGHPTRILVSLPGPEKEAPSSIEDEIRAFQVEVLRHMRLNLDVEVESKEDHLELKMNGPDRDGLLQNRAELLEAFQYLLNRIFGRRLGKRILADCDGFRGRKEEELRQIAKRVAEKVKLTGTKQELGLMNPYERRIVHLTVAAEEGVSSSSHGEGFLKRITVMPA